MDLEHLNPEQKEAVLHDRGPLLILAGAGSGKTRVITHRIAYLIEERNVSPYRIMAITFTNKAAKEMRERVDALTGFGGTDVWVSTFHSTCARILRRHGQLLGYEQNFSIYDADDSKNVVKDILKSFNLDPKRYKEKSFLIAISNAKNELVGPERYLERMGSGHDEQIISRVYAEYQKRLRSNNAMDFDDLLMQTVLLFRNNPEALRYYSDRFEYIMVDEYQDTNRAQFEFIHLLASHENEQGEIEHNLCVVGDDDQSIYKFRGADIRNILDFETVFPETKVIKLEQNYRSTGNILTAANEVIRRNHSRKDKRLRTEKKAGDPVIVTRYDDDRSEAADIAREIGELTESGRMSCNSFAVLYRTNAQSRSIEEKFIYRGLPYRLVGGTSFYSRKEIRDILAYLRTIDNGVDDQQVKRILNVPKRGIGAATIGTLESYALERDMNFFDALERADQIPGLSRAREKLSRFAALIYGLRGMLKKQPLTEFLRTVIAETGYEDYLAEDPETKDDRLLNLQELINKAAVFEQENPEDPSLSAFLSEVSLVSDLDSTDSSEEKVTLMTLHSAKGLEFDNVYIVGMEEGLFPSAMSGFASEEDLEEERRLFYVGITRAKETLHLSSCNSRFMHGELAFNKPSRFLKELPRDVISIRGDAYSNRYLSEGSGSASKYRSREPEDIGFPPFVPSTREPKPLPDSVRSGMLSDLLGSGMLKKGISRTEEPALTEKTYTAPVIVPTASLGYAVGDTVKHMRFGTGTVVEITNGTKDFEVTVDFPSGRKKMLASFAKLVKVP